MAPFGRAYDAVVMTDDDLGRDLAAFLDEHRACGVTCPAGDKGELGSGSVGPA